MLTPFSLLLSSFLLLLPSSIGIEFIFLKEAQTHTILDVPRTIRQQRHATITITITIIDDDNPK